MADTFTAAQLAAAKAWPATVQGDTSRFKPDLVTGGYLRFEPDLGGWIASNYGPETVPQESRNYVKVDGVVYDLGNLPPGLSPEKTAQLMDVWRRFFPDGEYGGMSPVLGVGMVLGAAFAAGAFGSLSGSLSLSSAAPDLASIDAAAGLVPEYGSSAAYSAGMSGTVEGANTVSTLEESIGNFGDWFQTDSGTMYNPNTGEYLTQDGTYNAGSLGSSATGGADAYSFSTDFLSTSSASNASLVNDIFSTPGKFLNSIKSALAGIGGVQASIARPAPNFTRAAGQVNLALPLLAVAGYFMLRG
jgi:hypothetical protein